MREEALRATYDQILRHHWEGDLDGLKDEDADEVLDQLVEELNDTFGTELDYEDVGGTFGSVYEGLKSEWDGETIDFLHDGKWYSPAEYCQLQMDAGGEIQGWSYARYQQCLAAVGEDSKG